MTDGDDRFVVAAAVMEVIAAGLLVSAAGGTGALLFLGHIIAFAGGVVMMLGAPE